MVTNDDDFLQYGKDKLFSLVWLHIPQSEAEALTTSFGKLTGEFKNFKGRLVVLEPTKWKDFPLGKSDSL